jgi:hypothetical protein
MISTKHVCWLRALAVVAILLYACGCSKGPEDPIIDSAEAQKKADEASDSLANLMMTVIDTTLAEADSSFRPHDVDFTDVNATYQRALYLDPNCKDAQFGAAFTGLLLVMTDPSFNELIEEFKRVYDTLQFNPLQPRGMAPKVGLGGRMFIESVPLKARRFGDIIPSPFELDRAVTKLALIEPSISQLQAILEASLLPRVQKARQHLAALVNDPSYTFMITPEMQGNEGASPIIVDRSDFQLFLTMAEGIEAGLHIFFARDLNLTAYTADGVQEALRKGSDFLSLKGSGIGAKHMADAKTRVLGCLNGIKQTIEYLKGEIGTWQENDLIKVSSEDLDDLDEIRDSVTSILSYFAGPRQLDVIWEKDSDWFWNGSEWEYNVIEDTISLTVDISMFFDNAMNNFKDFIPDYTVTVEPSGDLDKSFAENHFSRDRYWIAMATIFSLTKPNDTPYFEYHLPDEDAPEYYRLLAEYPASMQMVFGWDDVYNYCGPGATDLWCYSSSSMWYYRDYWNNPDRLVACYEWDAATFGDLEFLNPTMNGLLPGMTSQQLKDIWTNDIELEWYRSDCDTIEVDID